ncbi:uncharacterized protein LOC110941189 [Helianthus annuus]|uniref:uncharacterized protein LOC110941189 n=1 Tax=Helianthus annuus TaxID=4232 RepID=UPI000B8F3E2C|nr:uncharacterized protein LOC110941189 [Helianthus annuus]
MDDIPPLFIPIDISEDGDSFSSNSSLIFFFQNLINEAVELEDMGISRKRKSIRRDREKCHENLMRDYFVEEPKFNEEVFHHRFRMSKRLFLKIVSDVQANNSWFQETLDATMKKSFTPMQKVTSAIKQLATGSPLDEYDEYLNMAERTSRDCLENFCETVCNLYASEFLRRPTSHDVALLYQAHEEKHHLPGMLGSLDYDGNAIVPVHIRDPPVEPVFDDTFYNELIDKNTYYKLKYDLVGHLGEQDLPYLLADSDDE